MKKLLSLLFSVSSAALLMTSCKKDIGNPANEGASAKTAAEADAANRGGGGLIPAPVYTLTKRDKDSLTYYNDGRLAKVQHSAASYTQYNYGFNTITAKTFSANQLDEEVTYQIDVNTGFAYESNWHGYSYYNLGTIHSKKTHKYEYDAEGHLQNKYNKDKPYERADFSWGDDGNLVTVYFHDENNGILYHMWYGRKSETDKLKLNPASSGLDPYLKIFGKAAKKMLAHEQLYYHGPQTPATSQSFNYQINDDGYPTSCTVIDNKTNKRIDQFAYGYRVTQ